MAEPKQDAIAGLRERAVIATIRAPDPDAAVATCEALLAGGVSALEITFTTPRAEEAIAEAVRRFADSGALVGAGTLRSPADADAAIAAGARYLVSPGLDPETARVMAAAEAPSLIGALTPTEVMAALAAGADLVKLFPSSLGGVAYMRALRGPLPDVRFVPTGGIGPAEVTAFLSAGAAAVGAGGELCPSAAIAAGDWPRITDLARTFTAAIPARPAD